MFAEIWTYLSLHYAPKARESISIRFGFSDSDEVEAYYITLDFISGKFPTTSFDWILNSSGE